jgi:hypothetical protein
MEQQVVLSAIPIDQIASIVETKVREGVAKAFQLHNQSSDERFLSPAETCKIFQPHISKVTLHQWTKDGLIQSHRMGGRKYYLLSEVIAAAKSIKKYDRDKRVVEAIA